ncbi:MAG: TolC family protein [Magnetococcales bacterium]|nr:TolC family protein [Magnetococcales bacterium]
MIDFKKIACAFSIVIALGGCVFRPAPLTPQERETRIRQDREAIFATDTPFAPGSLTLEMAMARAVRDHLSTRVKAMEVALAQGLTDVASYRQLPTLAVNAGYEARDRPTTESLDQYESAYALSVAWNVLDFGVSHLHARQQADRAWIAAELRRKAAHTLMQEVQSAYWRAWAAQRLQARLDPLLQRVRGALRNAREAEIQRLQPPMQILDYQKSMLKTWQQLQESWRGVSGARVTLAELMNVHPGTPLELAAPPETIPMDLERFPPLARLEMVALRQRPELREKDYQARIQALETRKELLRLLPGIEFKSSRDYNSGNAYRNHLWAESGIKLVWNLLNLLSAPSQLDLSDAQELHQAWLRRALSLSILAQVQVGYRRLSQSMEEYDTARALSEVNERIFQHATAGRDATSMNEQELIQREAERLISETRRDMAHAELRQATAALFVSLGADLLPDTGETLPPLAILESRIAQQLKAWEKGEIPGLDGTPEADSLLGIPSGVAEVGWRVEVIPDSFWQDVARPEWHVEPVAVGANADTPGGTGGGQWESGGTSGGQWESGGTSGGQWESGSAGSGNGKLAPDGVARPQWLIESPSPSPPSPSPINEEIARPEWVIESAGE